jgi:branched-chain amino acid transport system permease protein
MLGIFLFAVGFGVAVPAVFGGDAYVMGLFVSALVVAGAAIAWAQLAHLGGMISFGHSAFFGVGGYASAIVSMKYGVPIPLAILIGGICAVVSSVVALPALRLRGPYFALSILAYSGILKVLATEMSGLTGGSAGLNPIPRLPTIGGADFSSKLGSYFVILVLISLFLLVYAAIRRSSFGLALVAMHESEDATRVLGVNSTLLKALMLLLSAFMTGTVGAFNAHIINFLEPDYAFGSSWVVVPMIAAVFGGYRTVFGPVFGAVALYLLSQVLFKNILPIGHDIILGILLVAMVSFDAAGLVPPVSRWTERWLGRRRGMIG